MDVKDFKLNSGLSRASSLSVQPRVKPEPNPKVETNPSGVVAKAAAALANTDALVSEIGSEAESLSGYVKSLGGILEQGLREASTVRITALQREANQVFTAIRERLGAATKSDPVSSDPLRSEVEAKLGRALEILFPDKPEKSPLEIEFSNKDLIISVQTRILKAAQYLDSLSEEEVVDTEFEKDLLMAETAQLNAESAQASLEDVNSAFELAKVVGSSIGKEPSLALSAIGDVRSGINLRG
jgi:phosphotransferase system HPr-like phosphotransfer protein